MNYIFNNTCEKVSTMMEQMRFSKCTLSLLAFLAFASCLGAQNPLDNKKTPNTGGWAYVEVENGDTLYSMSLNTVTITAKRIFKTKEERQKYYLYKRCAAKAYPYAMQALELYQEFEEDTEDLGKRGKRKYRRKKKKEVKDEFKDQMKKLTKTQGYILIKMIERQTDQSFYTLIKDTQGGVNATYWHNLGKIWGYDLKDQYNVGKDTLLDEVLLEYDFGETLYKY